MSKSKGNGVAPAEMAAKYGVDTLRVAMLFGSPPDKDLNFDEKLLSSTKQYLDRVSRLADNVFESDVAEFD